ncbi:MAG TPA: hypothetical protein VLG76_05100 [Rhabdochlamydiaceae bacterium]|nr:hypothetical protein [Rhabdochlamydiaceae bacterium]
MSVLFDLENGFNGFLSTAPPSPPPSPASFHFQREVEDLSPILTDPDSPLEVSQTALEVNQYVSSTLPILSSQQATASQNSQPLFPNPRVGKLLELYDNEFRSRFIGAVTLPLFNQTFSDFLERYIALNGPPALQPPPAQVQILEKKQPNIGKRKLQEVKDFSSTKLPLKTLRTRPTSLRKQFPHLFVLIGKANRVNQKLCFQEIKEYLEDYPEVEYKISLFLFAVSKINSIVAKMLRKALSKEGINTTLFTSEERTYSSRFDNYRYKLVELIKNKEYFHIYNNRRIRFQHMQADFERIDAHTRFFEKIENE